MAPPAPMVRWSAIWIREPFAMSERVRDHPGFVKERLAALRLAQYKGDAREKRREENDPTDFYT